MVICESLKNKVIIVAENDEQLAEEIRFKFKDSGFLNIKIVRDGRKIYEILRQYYNNPEQVGLVVVNENLPQCQVMEMCMTLSYNDNGSLVPFIIIRTDKESDSSCLKLECSSHSKCINHFITLPINYSEFWIVVGYQLNIKNERFLRYKQEERLINELAERKVVNAKLKYLVVHDELTSLLNRQNFERQLRLILGRSKMLQQNGALLFIDIDRFGLINELEGFDTGDRLLVEVVSIIRKRADKSDLFSRIGSDEFCLFLENKTINEVKLFAEKIRQLVYDFRFFTDENCYNASISIGVSTLKSASVVYHPGELISRARQACNMAKLP